MKIIIKWTKNPRAIKDIFIMLLIVLLPFLFYLYDFTPKTDKWMTGWFEVHSGHFHNVNFYAWLICVKLLTLSILSIWFITCTHLWKNIIIISILIEIYKILIIVKVNNLGYNYEAGFGESLLYSIPFIFLLILIDKVFGYSKKRESINNLVNNEINNQLIRLSKFNTNSYKNVSKEFNSLKSKQTEMNKKEYLAQLLRLRDLLSI